MGWGDTVDLNSYCCYFWLVWGFCFVETGSPYTGQSGLELEILVSASQVLGLQDTIP